MISLLLNRSEVLKEELHLRHRALYVSPENVFIIYPLLLLVFFLCIRFLVQCALTPNMCVKISQRIIEIRCVMSVQLFSHVSQEC